MADTVNTSKNLLNEIFEKRASLSEEEVRENLDRERINAVNLALQDLVASPEATRRFEENVRRASEQGRLTYRLKEWSFDDRIAYGGRFLLDLLSKGDLAEQIQNWLDENYSLPDKRFMVAYHKVHGSRNRYALLVSWDQSGFDKLSDIMTRNRELAQERAAARESGAPVSRRERPPREDRRPPRDDQRPPRLDRDDRRPPRQYRESRETADHRPARRDGDDRRPPRGDERRNFDDRPPRPQSGARGGRGGRSDRPPRSNYLERASGFSRENDD